MAKISETKVASARRKILAIPGSTKSSSSSLSILNFLKKRFAGKVEFNLYDKIGQLPHFNPELEEQLPESISELRSLIKDSDGVIFCTPEYVFSLPGSLKNVIEWNVSTMLFSGKPVAIIVAAGSGKKAFESLALILTTLEATLSDSSKLLIQGAKGKINADGEIIDREVISKIEQVVLSLLKTIDE